MTATRPEFLTAWCRLTGDPIREARHRLRKLYETQLLPRANVPLRHDDLALILLAFLASETHKDAPDVVRAYAEFRCSAWEPGGDDSLGSGSLLAAITSAMRPPLSIVMLEASPTVRTATLAVMKNGDPFSSRNYWFADASRLDLPATTRPIVIKRTIYADVINELLAELRMNDQPARSTAAGTETREAEDPPSTTPRSKSQQATARVSTGPQPTTEQFTHAQTSEQDPDQWPAFPFERKGQENAHFDCSSLAADSGDHRTARAVPS